jgi:hypothetical protein
MDNTLTAASSSLLITYTTALAGAKQELAYWQAQSEAEGPDCGNDISKNEIEKWASEIQKYEKLIEEFLKKTPVGQEDWFTNFTGWILKAFDIFWYIFKKINTPPSPSPKEREL